VAKTNAICFPTRSLTLLRRPWTADVLCELVARDACDYQSLLQSLSGIKPTTLADRCIALVKCGLAERRIDKQSPTGPQYALTVKGRELGFLCRSLREWGNKYEEIPR
jgi:DNA-binding HxlR family transcriptional regulator